MAQEKRPVVAVTAPEFRKGSDIFASASDFEMLPAPSGEAELAAWIREHQAWGENVQQGGLARTGGTHDDHQLALFHGKAGIMEGVDGDLTHMVCFGNIFKFNKRHKLQTPKQQEQQQTPQQPTTVQKKL